MEKFQVLSKEVLKNVGGVENITGVTHCATRLRINYKDKNKINENNIKKIKGISGFANKQGQLQLIIGPTVNDAYYAFLEESGWSEDKNTVDNSHQEVNGEKKDFVYWANKVGNFVAPIFMPIIPALIVGGMILSIKNLLVNYFGMGVDSGTAQLMLNIFDAAFKFLPIYIGYTLATQLKMQPIMGAMLGAVLIAPTFESGVVTDFFGITIPQVSYASTILPVVMGVVLMYYVDNFFKKIIPEFLIFFVKPLLTMIVVVPVTLIVLGPFGNFVSAYVADFVMWLTDDFGFLAVPIMAVLGPYMTMFGFDKGLQPVGIELIASRGFDPITRVFGFISNISVGGTTLALATSIDDKAEKGIAVSSGVTALCGVTEPAFYGNLISRPQLLIGTAIGSAAAGLFAGIVGLKTFVFGGCPGLLTLLFFVGPDGSLKHVYLALVTAAIAVSVSFLATMFIIKRNKLKTNL